MSTIKEKIYETYSTRKVNKDGKNCTINTAEIWADHTFARIKNYLPSDLDANILDIGTGAGNILYMLNVKGYRNLCGIDISKEQVDIAKKMVPQANIYHMDLIEYLEGKENQFDLITGFDIIEHFTKDEAYNLLSKVNKALKTNGKLILQTPNAYSPWSGSVCYGDLTHEWFYTPNSLDDLLIQCGFHNYEAKEISPIPIGLKGIVRLLLWKFTKQMYKIINTAEIGISGKDQIFSRVFIAKAVKNNFYENK